MPFSTFTIQSKIPGYPVNLFRNNIPSHFNSCAILNVFLNRVNGVDGQSVEEDDDYDDDDDEYQCGVRLIDEHRVSGFCCYRVTKYPEYQAEPFVYSGPDVMTTFYDHIMHEAENINSIVPDDEEMQPVTSAQCKEYDEDTHCGNCGKL